MLQATIAVYGIVCGWIECWEKVQNSKNDLEKLRLYCSLLNRRSGDELGFGHFLLSFVFAMSGLVYPPGDLAGGGAMIPIKMGDGRVAPLEGGIVVGINECDFF